MCSVNSLFVIPTGAVARSETGEVEGPAFPRFKSSRIPTLRVGVGSVHHYQRAENPQELCRINISNSLQ
jgi:hypothetical protein